MENFLKERTPYVDERPIAPYVNKHTTKKEEDIVKFIQLLQDFHYQNVLVILLMRLRELKKNVSKLIQRNPMLF